MLLHQSSKSLWCCCCTPFCPPTPATADDAAEFGDSAKDDSKKVDEKVDGVVIIDAGGSMLLVNKIAYKMFGYIRYALLADPHAAMWKMPCKHSL